MSNERKKEQTEMIALWIQLRGTIDQVAYWYMLALWVGAGAITNVVWKQVTQDGGAGAALIGGLVLLGVAGIISGFAMAVGRRSDPGVLNGIRRLVLEQAEGARTVHLPEVGPERVSGAFCAPGAVFATVMFALAALGLPLVRWLSTVGICLPVCLHLILAVLFALVLAIGLGCVASRVYFKDWSIWLWEIRGGQSVAESLMCPIDTAAGARLKIISGGQTGADRAALDVALSLNLEHGGWCPRGRHGDDGPIPERYGLAETSLPDPSQRTEWNVRDSNATVVFEPSSGRTSEGTRLTIEKAKEFCRPLMTIEENVATESAASRLVEFVRKNRVRTLNVAGPRASEDPGVGRRVTAVLGAALGKGQVDG